MRSIKTVKMNLSSKLYSINSKTGAEKDENRKTIRSNINANAQQRKQPAQGGSCPWKRRKELQTIVTRAYDLECHRFTPTEKEMHPTCPKVPACKETNSHIFM